MIFNYLRRFGARTSPRLISEMWPTRNGWATRGGIVVAIAGALLGQVQPLPGQEIPAGSPGSAELQAPLLDGAHARYAHGLVERWLAAGGVDRPGEEHAAAEQRVTDLFAVRVTLRQQGFTVAIGDAVRDDAAAAIDAVGPAVSVTELTRRATAAAIEELRRNLGDAHRRAASDPRLREAQREGAAAEARVPLPAELAPTLLVDVQLARHPVTVTLPRNPGPGAALGAFAPGYHGVRIVGARGTGALVWPATAIAQNLSPRSQLVQGLADEGHGLLDLPKLGVPGGPTLQRFEAIHVVRPGGGQPVMELVRGGVTLPPIAMNMRTLRELADRLAIHLERRITDDGLVRGTFHPTRSEYDPPVAGPEDTAWAFYSMSRYARHVREQRPRGDELGERIARHTGRYVRRALDAEVAFEPAAAALLLLAIIDDGLPDPEGGHLRDALGRQLLGPVEETSARQLRVALPPVPGVTPAEEEPALATMNAATQALATAALAAWYEQTRDPRAGEAVSQSLEGLWNASNGRLPVGVLPWYMAATSRVGKLLAGDDRGAAARLAERRQRLAELVDMLAQQQIIERPVLGPRDVIGGFELVVGPPGSPPSPNWYTAHLLHFVGLAIADEEVGKLGDRFGWVITGGLAARFVGQLMMDEPAAFYVGDRGGALRGVRLAPWDNTMPVYATAISLLAVTQLQEAAEAVLPHAIDVGPGVLDAPVAEE